MTRNHAACLPRSVTVRTKLFQCQQAEFAPEIPDTQLLVVVVVFPLELHTAKPHADPGVKLLEVPATGRKASGEVICRAPDDSVQFHDHTSIQIVVTWGQLSDLVLELLHGLVPHAPRVDGQMEPEEVIPLPIGRNLRFLRAQVEPEFPLQHTPNQFQRLLRLRAGLAEHYEIVGVSHEAVAGAVELPVEPIQHDIRKEG